MIFVMKLLQGKHTEFSVYIMYYNQITEASLLETIYKDMKNVFKKLCYVEMEFYLYFC